MEQRLAADNPVDWSPTPGAPPAGPELITKDKEIVITRLESQVEEQVGTNSMLLCLFAHFFYYFSQRLLRLQDAKQVEAKAAKIKEWVTNKLREVSHQCFLCMLKKICTLVFICNQFTLFNDKHYEENLNYLIFYNLKHP
jgi:hypothetical protein